MHSKLAKYFLYYPTVLMKGELIPLYFRSYENFQFKKLEEIKFYQLTHIHRMVDYALRSSQFYVDLYAGCGISSGRDLRTLADVRRLPSITKADLIVAKDRFYTCRKYWSGTKTTGGSTGHPVQIKKNPSALARERVATWRAYRWAGVDIGDVQARFWGVPHSRIGRIKMQVTDMISNRIRLSAFELDHNSLDAYYRNILRVGPAYLYGYVSAISALAEHMLEKGYHGISSLKSIITTSEILTEPTRKRIEIAFGCKVFNEYGCGEVGSIAHECEFGKMHIMADNLHVDVDAKSNSGELVVTDFFNLATPLIRYKLGDYATLEDRPCECGRTLPLLSGVHGRAYDLIKTRENRVIHPESIIYVFESLQAATESIKQFQVIQKSIDHLQILLVPNKGWNANIEHRLRAGIIDCMSTPVIIQIDLCEAIAREASGKMRLVKSEV
jgi:phenylacetate-CoA ligase